MRRPDDFAELLGSHDDLLFFIGVPSGGVDALTITVADDAYMLEHGIGPGCEGPGTSALPPVRELRFLRAVDYGVGDPDAYARSICDPTFVPEFADLGARLLEDLDITGCIDGRPCHDDPECEVFGHPILGGQDTRIEECARGDDGAYLVDPATGRPAMPGPGVELCWVMQADDDRDDYCTELGRVASFDVVTIDGRSPALDIRAVCSLLSH